jgi:ketosteroid isomerase-like protein
MQELAMAKTVGAILADVYDAWRAQDIDWLGSYLPNDFCHVIHIPTAIHPLGGARHGKKVALERFRQIVARYEILHYDTSDLMIEKNHAAVEIPFHYRHRGTGTVLETTKANFWTLEDGWPVRLTEYYDVTDLQAFFGPVVPHAQA